MGDALFFFFSALGDTYAYLVVVPILFWTTDRHRYMRVLLFMVTVGFLNSILKDLFQLPRPHVIDPRIVSVGHKAESGLGFPSGHVMSATAFWCYLAWQQRSWGFSALAVAVTGAIGFSRMYLGCHWPADVLGGLVIGGAAATLLTLLDARRQRLPERARFIAAAIVTTYAAAFLAACSHSLGRPDGFHGAAILVGCFVGWAVGGKTELPLTRTGRFVCCVLGLIGSFLLYRASRIPMSIDPRVYLAALGFGSGLWIVWLAPRLAWLCGGAHSTVTNEVGFVPVSVEST